MSEKKWGPATWKEVMKIFERVPDDKPIYSIKVVVEGGFIEFKDDLPLKDWRKRMKETKKK